VLIGKRINVHAYADGRVELSWEGRTLPYRIYDIPTVKGASLHAELTRRIGRDAAVLIRNQIAQFRDAGGSAEARLWAIRTARRAGPHDGRPKVSSISRKGRPCGSSCRCSGRASLS